MMSSPVAGIDPHQATFTVAVVDANGVEITLDTFDNSSAGYLSWGSHVAVALCCCGVRRSRGATATLRAATSRPASGHDQHRRCGGHSTGSAR